MVQWVDLRRWLVHISHWGWSQVANAIPASLCTSPDLERRARFTVVIILTIGSLLVVRLATLVTSGMYRQSVLVFGCLLVCGLSIWGLKRTGSLVIIGNVVVSAFFVTGMNMAIQRGGIGSAILIGLGALPLLALFAAGVRSGIVWLAVMAVAVTSLAIYEYVLGHSLPDQFRGSERILVETFGALLFPVTLFLLGLAYEWTKNAALAAQALAERERLRVEEAARMLRADRMASVGQLAAGIAHEVNNPLGYIAGNLDFIESSLRQPEGSKNCPTRVELSEAVAEARQGIERVTSIVRDLKTFARDDDQSASVVDLRVAMRSTVRIAENELRHRALLECDYDSKPVTVRANESRVVQVFLNVLVNASHAISPGRASENFVRVTVRRDGARACVVVADSGSGMTPEVLARATEPFFTTKAIGVGTGLGLSVCKNVIESIGGNLEIHSAPNEGTRVAVTLPLVESAPDAVVRPVPLPGASLPPRRVLVIDDDPLVGRALGRLLRSHEVTTVDSARRALSMLSSGQRFDLILCDLMMPELTGADVYERVASFGEGIEKQIVFLTGGVFTDRIRSFLESVPNHRFEKPIRADHLDKILATGPGG